MEKCIYCEEEHKLDNTGCNNSGYWNSGYENSGDRNSGNGNSGYWNSGNGNSGYNNSGYRNSGYGNSTNRESGLFNSEEGTIRMFNKPTNLKWNEIEHPHFIEFYLNKWVSEDNMTDEEKTKDPDFYIRKGYLKTFSWEDAWANFWKNTSEANRNKILNLPNFDSNIFKNITGIDIGSDNLIGKEVEVKIKGKTYKVVIKE